MNLSRLRSRGKKVPDTFAEDGHLGPAACLLVALATVVATGPSTVSGQSFRQAVESQPVRERGAAEASPDETDAVRRALHEGPRPMWIWGADDDVDYVLRSTFEAQDVRAAALIAACDNVGRVRVNGTAVASGSEWQSPMLADVTPWLVEGENRIEAEVSNRGGIAGFVLRLAWQDAAGQTHHHVTDLDWQATEDPDSGAWQAVARRGRLGDGPWGDVFAQAADSRVPPGTFEVPPGFRVDKLFTVPREELGSWVCIAFDDQGRLLASDQGDQGICRITLPPPDSPAGETTVERLDFSRCEIRPTAAQGMLWAFDSLYLCINGGPGSGLYRARDLNGDGRFDECVRLRPFRGGGEHGPHALRLSPDGRRIFVIAGNHTRPPFAAGDELDNPDYRSRIPTDWDEDLLLPRLWDANGHARGVLAPGGWVASTDPDGQTWDIWSVGYRNPYDMAFNADGELFVYDADMEWDIGMPWYRPTRVVHATSGSEFGWRSGSGKWPDDHLDSLPPLANIGPGSPVGVEFGYGLRFPARHQTALYLCDWTFGTMYALHLEPQGSSYRATQEEFLSRTPLPLTDVAAGPDGALYFAIGGRGTQSELFRVTYHGEESTAAVDPHQRSLADRRDLRHRLERHHGELPREDQPLDPETNHFLTLLGDQIPLADPFLRMAAWNAFYASRLFWHDLQAEHLDEAEMRDVPPPTVISAIGALARAPHAALIRTRGYDESQGQRWLAAARRLALRELGRLAYSELEEAQQLDYLRALSLVFLRLGEPDETTSANWVDRLGEHFPGPSDRVNRELVQMLVYLGDPAVIGKTVALLERPAEPTGMDGIDDLLARNRGYGGAIRRSIENAPDQQQIWYAFVLRNVRDGWTMAQREAYFRWFERARGWSGGASYQGFLRDIERDAFDNASEQERLLIEASGARQRWTPPELPQPQGPPHPWAVPEVLDMAATGLRGRDFENGEKMYAAARCIVCHRFGGEGGATGPDLTQLAGRFNVKDLTEAIVDPSKDISDQYRASNLLTLDGQAISGRIVAEDERSLTILTDPEDSTRVTRIERADIEEIVPSPVSIMPEKLLDSLNRDEVLDLLAYLLSRGDRRDPMFRPDGR